MTHSISEQERLLRKRHAAKLRQRRCREKKRLQGLKRMTEASPSATNDSNTTLSPQGLTKTEAKPRQVSPATAMKPLLPSKHAIVQAVPFPKLHTTMQQSLQHPYASPHHAWQQQQRHQQQLHLHIHTHFPHSPYAANVSLSSRLCDSQRPAMVSGSRHSASMTWSSPQMPRHDSMSSSLDGTSSQHYPMTASPLLDTQEVAAITAMLSLSSQVSLDDDDDDEQDEASTSSLTSASSHGMEHDMSTMPPPSSCHVVSRVV